MSNTSQQTRSAKDRAWIITLTILFGVMALLLFYTIICIWPSGYVSSKDPFKLFGSIYTITAEHRFLLLMVLGGALGANVHLIISFTAFVGNRTFVTTWIPWYLLRPLIGAGMAMFFYMLLRGGILTYSPPVAPELPENNQTTEVAATPAVTEGEVSASAVPEESTVHGATTQDTTAADSVAAASDSTAAIPAAEKSEATQQRDSVPLNPYGMMAIACLVGLFSKEASEKLEEVFKTLFNVKEKVQYKDPLPADKNGNGNGNQDVASQTDAADTDLGDSKTEPTEGV
ncbi:MATE family efflux transporter [Chitinophaga ginsengisoli]|uniref:Uncharacterized protein n=1 Tax=Chitinophaga ginsengisoli TaxID=363837 RepID=A0A2P8G7J8_9BACT|nr:hypothetical protein [Chitinophaga ginsengisoli]PSL29963.1 hypothetical protein CLV42_106299 [Chitinophaga ginsengisoli]